MSYDPGTDLLELALDVDRDNSFAGGEIMSFTVDLGPTKSLYIRAASDGNNPTELNDLALNANPLSISSFSTLSNSYLEVSGFTWDSMWTLTGDIIMDGSTGASSRPSVQLKLTDLDPNPIPVPGAALLFGSALAWAGARRQRRG